MITTTTSGSYTADPYASYVTIPNAGSFYAGGRVTTTDATQTFTYDFPRSEKRKETDMFTTRIHQYIDGTYGVDVLYKDRIVQTSNRTWKRYEKAQAAGEELIAAAVSKLFDLE